jgi:hypothetical protein
MGRDVHAEHLWILRWMRAREMEMGRASEREGGREEGREMLLLALAAGSTKHANLFRAVVHGTSRYKQSGRKILLQ